MSTSDEELVRQSRAGCLVSFEGLVRRHEARIHRFVWQRCGCGEDARDLTQVVFVTAFQKLDQFHPEHSFAAWLFAIARNKTVDWLRRRRDTEPVEDETLVDYHTPATTAAEQDDAAAIWKLARAVLSPAQFEAVWLHYQEDLSLVEVAGVTRQSVVGVKVTLFRARQKLGMRLRERGWLDEASGGAGHEARRVTTRKISAVTAKA
jgi:RNA polymerase sigma-70 factor (ECF subfamily)